MLSAGAYIEWLLLQLFRLCCHVAIVIPIMECSVQLKALEEGRLGIQALFHGLASCSCTKGLQDHIRIYKYAI